MPEPLNLLPPWFWLGVVFVVGACVGSFLNVAIYRLPRGMRVDRPRRSFCPHCQQPIPAWRNLPLITWLVQGGKAACCGQRIALRYLLVELLTGLLFALSWWLLGWPLGLVLLPWLALLILGSAIDLEHMLLPDVVTMGGLVLGLAAAALVPALHGVEGWWPGLRAALIGAGFGLLLLALVWQGGKLAFGKLRLNLPHDEDFVVEEREGDVVLALDQEALSWGEMFGQRGDELKIWAKPWRLEFTGGESEQGEAEALLRFGRESVQVDGRQWPLADLERVAGRTRRLLVPREAMGFGDVLLVGMIGAWCGWQGTLFALGGGAILGLLVGLPLRWLGARTQRNFQMPFGPFLAAAAVIWMFGGREWWDLYFSVLQF